MEYFVEITYYEEPTERGRIQSDILRMMIESEHISDRAEARRLIDQGRTEGRR